MAEVLMHNMWRRALCVSQFTACGGVRSARTTLSTELFAAPSPCSLYNRPPVWSFGRGLFTRNGREGSWARAAGKSLWLDDNESAAYQQGGPQKGSGKSHFGRNNEKGSPDDESESSWDVRPPGRERPTTRESRFDRVRRPQQGGYIDEWGSTTDEEPAPETSARGSGRTSTSYNHRDNPMQEDPRKRSQKKAWDGEWGEYLDRVERRRPKGGQEDWQADENLHDSSSRRQMGGFGDERGVPLLFDAEGGGDNRGSGWLDEGTPGSQRVSRDRTRPGISKYNERWKRGGGPRFGGDGEARGRQPGGYGGATEGTFRGNGRNGYSDRLARDSEDDWSRDGQDKRRGRGFSGEDEEGGPLVKGGIELNGEVLYGVAPVQAAIRARRRELYTLYVQENLRPRKKGDKVAVERIRREAQAAGATLQEASKHTLNLLADNRPHQGLVLDAAPLSFTHLDELPPPPTDLGPASGAPVWVAMDEVVDPQNFGAVLRSAYFLGAAGVLTCARNSSPLTAVVSKASAGAAEAMEVFSCGNMPTVLEVAVQDGWRVLGASADPQAPLVTELPKGAPTVIVLGNEGVGLRTNVRRACSGFVRIAGKGTAFPAPSASTDSDSREVEEAAVRSEDESDGEGGEELVKEESAEVVVDSLNVSVAAGILLHELLAPRPNATMQAVGMESANESSKQADEVLSQLLSTQVS